MPRSIVISRGTDRALYEYHIRLYSMPIVPVNWRVETQDRQCSLSSPNSIGQREPGTTLTHRCSSSSSRSSSPLYLLHLLIRRSRKWHRGCAGETHINACTSVCFWNVLTKCRPGFIYRVIDIVDNVPYVQLSCPSGNMLPVDSRSEGLNLPFVLTRIIFEYGWLEFICSF